MRIIAGTARGRRIELPDGRTTRPILSILKGRLFNILGADFDGEVVWDLFAGSGTLGLEALSRGAALALMVERDPEAFRLLEANARRLGFATQSRLIRGDCMRVPLEGPPPTVIFLDPPFALSTERPDELQTLLRFAGSRAAPGARLVLRTSSAFRWPFEPESLVEYDRRDHGENALIFMRPGT